MLKTSFIAFVVSVAVVLAGCASTTVIQSEPNGAQLRIDAQPVGATPVTFTEGAVWHWTKHSITLEAPGYRTYHGQMTTQVAPLYIVLGLLCLLPFLLVAEFKPSYYYIMVQEEAASLLTEAFSEAVRVDFR